MDKLTDDDTTDALTILGLIAGVVVAIVLCGVAQIVLAP